MSIVFFLIPLGLVLVAVAVWAFVWAVNHGQFDDLDKAAHSILFDDDEAPPAEATPADAPPAEATPARETEARRDVGQRSCAEERGAAGERIGAEERGRSEAGDGSREDPVIPQRPGSRA